MAIQVIRTLVVWALAISNIPRVIQITDDQSSEQGIGGNCRKYAREAFDLTNDYRTKQGLPQLLWDRNLETVVNEHAKMMVEDPNMVAPDHPGFFDRVEKAQKIGSWTGGVWENIAVSSGREEPAKAAMLGWIESPPHERTLCSHAKFGAVGCAYSPVDRSYFFSQLFTNPEREMPKQLSNRTQPRGDLACQVFDSANYARFKHRLKQFHWAQDDLYPAISNFTMDAADAHSFGTTVDASVVGKNAGHGVTWFGKIGLITHELQGYKYDQRQDVGDELIEKLAETAQEYLYGNYSDLAVGCAQTPEGSFYFGLLFAEREKSMPMLDGQEEPPQEQPQAQIQGVPNQGQHQVANGQQKLRQEMQPQGQRQVLSGQQKLRQEMQTSGQRDVLEAQQTVHREVAPIPSRQGPGSDFESDQPPPENPLAQQSHDYHLQLQHDKDEKMHRRLDAFRMEHPEQISPLAYPNQNKLPQPSKFQRARPLYNGQGQTYQAKQQGAQLQRYQQQPQNGRPMPSWQTPVNKYQHPGRTYYQQRYQPQEPPSSRQPYQPQQAPYPPQPYNYAYDLDRQQALRDDYVYKQLVSEGKLNQKVKAPWPPPREPPSNPYARNQYQQQPKPQLPPQQQPLRGVNYQQPKSQWSPQQQPAYGQPPQNLQNGQQIQHQRAQPVRGLNYQNQQMYQPQMQQQARDQYRRNQQSQMQQQQQQQQPSMYPGRQPPSYPQAAQNQFQPQRHVQPPPQNQQYYDRPSNVPQQQQYQRPPNTQQQVRQPGSQWKTPVNKYEPMKSEVPYWLSKPPAYMQQQQDRLPNQSSQVPTAQPYPQQRQPNQAVRPLQQQNNNRPLPQGPITHQKQQPSFMEQQQQLRRQNLQQQYAQQGQFGPPPVQRYADQNVPPPTPTQQRVNRDVQYPEQRYPNQNAPPPGKRYAFENIQRQADYPPQDFPDIQQQGHPGNQQFQKYDWLNRPQVSHAYEPRSRRSINPKSY